MKTNKNLVMIQNKMKDDDVKSSWNFYSYFHHNAFLWRSRGNKYSSIIFNLTIISFNWESTPTHDDNIHFHSKQLSLTIALKNLCSWMCFKLNVKNYNVIYK